MNIKSIGSMAVIVWLGWLAPWLALAQPVITTQPKDQFLTQGRSASFSVAATGAAPFSYQWLYDGVAMAGATNNYILVGNAQPAKSGYYSVIVSNASGSVTSQVAELKVFVAAPHSLSGIQAESNGCVNLSLKGETTVLFAPYYDLYPLEASSNLLDWTPLALLQRTNAEPDTLRFVDPDAPKFSQRFYRTPTNQLATFLPKPTGPNAVGVVARLLTDSSRPNRRPFMVSIWYPAVTSASGLPNSYMDPRIAASYGNSLWGLGTTGGSIYQSVYAFAHPNAPLSLSETNFPIVIYSHGQLGVRTENTAEAENLASQGYIVIGIDHNGAWESVYPNGTIVSNTDPNTSNFSDPTYAALILRNMQDIQFVMDELALWNQGDPFFQGHLDLGRIGAFGWSMGGATVVELCANDSRCQAVVSLDGGGLMKMAPFHQALLYVYGDAGAGDSVTGFFEQYFASLFGQLTNHAYMFEIKGAIHYIFSDSPMAFDVTKAGINTGIPGYGPPMATQLHMAALLRTYTLSFFNRYLKGQDDHVLDGPLPEYPEIQNYQKK